MEPTKSLNFVYNWIGPEGPLPNHKIPSIYDLVKKSPYISVEHNSITDEHDTIAYDLENYVNCNFIPCYQLGENFELPFLFEIVLSPKNNYLQNTLNIGNGILENVSIDERILDLIRHKNGYLLLTSKHESFVENADFDTIHDYFSAHNVPLNKIIYATNCFNCKERYNDYCAAANVTTKINCEYLNLYILDQCNLANRRDFIRYLPNIKNKKKLFLNWNRRIKSHRILFLLYSIRYNFLDSSYISFSKLHLNQSNWIRDALSLSAQFGLGFTTSELTDIYNQLPLVLDSDNFDRFPVEDDMFSTVDWYDRTFISIVSETNFENNIIHMTEKTIKPILFKQPFIIVGPSNTLSSLKQLGFKTFDNFWDESYDSTFDNQERFIKIAKICKDISLWSEKELFKFAKRSREITEYNFNIMQNLQPTNILDFLKKYGA